MLPFSSQYQRSGLANGDHYVVLTVTSATSFIEFDYAVSRVYSQKDQSPIPTYVAHGKVTMNQTLISHLVGPHSPQALPRSPTPSLALLPALLPRPVLRMSQPLPEESWAVSYSLSCSAPRCCSLFAVVIAKRDSLSSAKMALMVAAALNPAGPKRTCPHRSIGVFSPPTLEHQEISLRSSASFPLMLTATLPSLAASLARTVVRALLPWTRQPPAHRLAPPTPHSTALILGHQSLVLSWTDRCGRGRVCVHRNNAMLFWKRQTLRPVRQAKSRGGGNLHFFSLMYLSNVESRGMPGLGDERSYIEFRC
jgi:hypothetical protein